MTSGQSSSGTINYRQPKIWTNSDFRLFVMAKQKAKNKKQIRLFWGTGCAWNAGCCVSNFDTVAILIPTELDKDVFLKAVRL